jgi:hypothetical protein
MSARPGVHRHSHVRDGRRRHRLTLPPGLEVLQFVQSGSKQVVQVPLEPGDPLVPPIPGE